MLSDGNSDEQQIKRIGLDNLFSINCNLPFSPFHCGGMVLGTTSLRPDLPGQGAGYDVSRSYFFSFAAH